MTPEILQRAESFNFTEAVRTTSVLSVEPLQLVLGLVTENPMRRDPSYPFTAVAVADVSGDVVPRRNHRRRLNRVQQSLVRHPPLRMLRHEDEPSFPRVGTAFSRQTAKKEAERKEFYASIGSVGCSFVARHDRLGRRFKELISGLATIFPVYLQFAYEPLG
jgi:hypothetical protein